MTSLICDLKQIDYIIGEYSEQGEEWKLGRVGSLVTRCKFWVNGELI